jgi:hypothetical protein
LRLTATAFGKDRAEEQAKVDVTPDAGQDRRDRISQRFLRKHARQGRFVERKAMIDPEHALPITRQAEELEISRSTVYYQPRPIPDADLFLMRRI